METKEFDIYNYFVRSNENVLLSYKGPFDKEVLSVILSYIKVVVISRDKDIGKKIFKIFIELAQNIAFYSPKSNSIARDKNSGEGAIAIIEYSDYFSISTGNIVLNKDVDLLMRKCEIINSLDTDGLREYKRKQLLKPDGPYGGGNIGLIKVALASANPLGVKISKLDDATSVFAISANIKK